MAEPIPITVSNPYVRKTILSVLTDIENNQNIALKHLGSIFESFGFDVEDEILPPNQDNTRDRIDDVLIRMRVIVRMLGKLSAEVF